MTSKREEFILAASAHNLPDGRPEHKAAKELRKLEKKLRKEIEKHIEDYRSGKEKNKNLEFEICKVPSGDHGRAIMSLPEIGRLYAICADPEVDVYIKVKTKGNNKLYVIIEPDTPHWLSDGADPPQSKKELLRDLHSHGKEKQKASKPASPKP